MTVLVRRQTESTKDEETGPVSGLSRSLRLYFPAALIDVGRSGQCHADLQNAVDVLLLRGASELVIENATADQPALQPYCVARKYVAPQ